MGVFGVYRSIYGLTGMCFICIPCDSIFKEDFDWIPVKGFQESEFCCKFNLLKTSISLSQFKLLQ